MATTTSTDPLGDLLKMIVPHKASLQALEAQSRARAAQAFVKPGNQIISNLGSSLKVPLHKQGHTEEIASIIKQASAQANKATYVAWRAGQSTAASHVAKEAKLLGLKFGGLDISSEADYLTSLLGDVNTNGASLLDKILGLKTPEEMASAFADSGRRASYSASVAANRGYSSYQLDAYKQMQGQNEEKLFKVWVTNFIPPSKGSSGTCGACAALDGQQFELEAEFPSDASFNDTTPEVYEDLEAPPRHPGCGCRLVLWHDGMAYEEDATTPADMQDTAQQWAEDVDGFLPSLFDAPVISDTAEFTDYVTTDDIKALPESKFQSLIDVFQGCLNAIKNLGG